MNDYSDTIENISRIIAEETTGSKITNMFHQIGLVNYDAQRGFDTTKWRRINESISSSDNPFQSMISVIEFSSKPQRFMNDKSAWKKHLESINKELIFKGYKLNDSGRVVKNKKVESYSEAQKMIKSLKSKLNDYDIHKNVLLFCQEQYLQDNYFHAIFEASKSVSDRIRKMSNSKDDGIKLINNVFNFKTPQILIKNNYLKTDTDKSLYNGIINLLKTIHFTYRNVEAHKPKLYDETSESDAIAAFVIISMAHKELDHCISIMDVY